MCLSWGQVPKRIHLYLNYCGLCKKMLRLRHALNSPFKLVMERGRARGRMRLKETKKSDVHLTWHGEIWYTITQTLDKCCWVNSILE